jgi:hypothetical protein
LNGLISNDNQIYAGIIPSLVIFESS